MPRRFTVSIGSRSAPVIRGVTRRSTAPVRRGVGQAPGDRRPENARRSFVILAFVQRFSLGSFVQGLLLFRASPPPRDGRKNPRSGRRRLPAHGTMTRSQRSPCRREEPSSVRWRSTSPRVLITLSQRRRVQGLGRRCPVHESRGGGTATATSRGGSGGPNVHVGCCRGPVRPGRWNGRADNRDSGGVRHRTDYDEPRLQRGPSIRWRVGGGPYRRPQEGVGRRPARLGRGTVLSGDVRVPSLGGCMSTTAPGYLNRQRGGGGTPSPGEGFGFAGYRFDRGSASATTTRGSSPSITGARRSCAPAREAACRRGSSHRVPQSRSSRAAGARPRPISVSE